MRWLAALAAGLLLGCTGQVVPGAELPIAPIIVGNHQVEVEIAANDRDRRRGLMFRESMPEDHGMLFLFPEERVRSFWMKDTRLPLSIAYADAGGRIVRILDLVPLSEQPRSSGSPVKYALEMHQGWFVRNGVFEGDAIARIATIEIE